MTKCSNRSSASARGPGATEAGPARGRVARLQSGPATMSAPAFDNPIVQYETVSPTLVCRCSQVQASRCVFDPTGASVQRGRTGRVRLGQEEP